MSVRVLRILAVTLSTLGILTLALTVERASAATPPIGLGTATSYAVLAGSTITNTGASELHGDRGLSPGTAVTGFPPGMLNGESHTADAEALQAQSDLTVAFVDAAGRTPETAVAAELGGSTFGPGVYVGPTLELTGSMTIDAGGDPDAVFLFKTNSTLVTGSDSSVVLIGDADPCNVYWLVNSSATLGTGTDFVGTVMALTSISANSGADVDGRLLARNGAVTFDDNVITRPECAVLPPGTTTSTTIAAETTVSTETTVPTETTVVDETTTTSTSSTTSIPPTVSTTSPSTPPTHPGRPGTPTGQGRPGGPTGPDSPGTPGTPTGLGSPGTPDAPTGPGSPGTPSGPGAPPTTLVATGSDMGTQIGIGLLALGGGVGILALRRRMTT